MNHLDTDFGLTRTYTHSTDDPHGNELRRQLADHGVSFAERELPGIVGMGGVARLVGYTSPVTGQPVTVLLTPHQWDVDLAGETYYYFDGLAWADATAADVDARWGVLYDRTRAHLDRMLGAATDAELPPL